MFTITAVCDGLGCRRTRPLDGCGERHNLVIRLAEFRWEDTDDGLLCPWCVVHRNQLLLDAKHREQLEVLTAAADAVNRNRNLSTMTGTTFLAAALDHEANPGQCAGGCGVCREAARVLDAEVDQFRAVAA